LIRTEPWFTLPLTCTWQPASRSKCLTISSTGRFLVAVRARQPVPDQPCADCLDQPPPAGRGRPSVAGRVAFWLVAFVFAATMLGTTLLLAGRSSDQAGRKPVLVVVLTFSALSTVVFILAPDAAVLVLARIVSRKR
jgi:MFS family permease